MKNVIELLGNRDKIWIEVLLDKKEDFAMWLKQNNILFNKKLVNNWFHFEISRDKITKVVNAQCWCTSINTPKKMKFKDI